MRVYKATNADMDCIMGSGRYHYVLGVPATAENSRCGVTGLHACEYVLDCIGYYGLGVSNRFFVAEASGDIAEDGTDTRIACTELTLVQELDIRGITAHAMMYMAEHPKRAGWEKESFLLQVKRDLAEALQCGAIAIARGEHPMARGADGACLGLVQATDSEVTVARLLTVGMHGIKPGIWYTLSDGMPQEVAK